MTSDLDRLDLKKFHADAKRKVKKRKAIFCRRSERVITDFSVPVSCMSFFVFATFVHLCG